MSNTESVTTCLAPRGESPARRMLLNQMSIMGALASLVDLEENRAIELRRAIGFTTKLLGNVDV